MISYHESTPNNNNAWMYADGWQRASDDDTDFLCHILLTKVWSPIVWREGVRRQANFTSAEFAVLDFDDGVMTLEEAKKTFCDLYHVIGTTRSHQKGKGTSTPCDRFRVLFKFTEAVTSLEVYRFNMKRLLSAFPADSQCKDGARFFYPCQEIVQTNFEVDSFYQEVYAAPTRRMDILHPQGKEEMMRPPGQLSSYVFYFFNNIIPIGSRNLACYRFAKDLIRAGYSTSQDVFNMIQKSETYKDTKIGGELEEEINRVIKSAFNSLN